MCSRKVAYHSLLSCSIDKVVKIYPTTVEEREKYISSKTNKCVTPFQFRVYDLCAQVSISTLSCNFFVINMNETRFQKHYLILCLFSTSVFVPDSKRCIV